MSDHEYRFITSPMSESASSQLDRACSGYPTNPVLVILHLQVGDVNADADMLASGNAGIV